MRSALTAMAFAGLVASPMSAGASDRSYLPSLYDVSEIRIGTFYMDGAGPCRVPQDAIIQAVKAVLDRTLLKFVDPSDFGERYTAIIKTPNWSVEGSEPFEAYGRLTKMPRLYIIASPQLVAGECVYDIEVNLRANLKGKLDYNGASFDDFVSIWTYASKAADGHVPPRYYSQAALQFVDDAMTALAEDWRTDVSRGPPSGKQ
jgi:hypothetical protein